MNKAQPIKDVEQLEKFKYFYRREEYQPRNYALITLGLNTALRISDLLEFRWCDVYDDVKRKFRTHVVLTEQKTGKCSVIYLNNSATSALEWYQSTFSHVPQGDAYLFTNDRQESLSRVQAYRIVRHAAQQCDIEGVISPHSLRKTFGYQAWQQGVSPVLLMDIYQHSSFAITKRYLGIEQDERDTVFQNVIL